jgi:exonuclease V
MSDDEFGSDIEFTQELEDVLSAAEIRPVSDESKTGPATSIDIEEIEDLIRLSPMEEFRKKGYLSVSDLVGTVWCEVQVSFRLPAEEKADHSVRLVSISLSGLKNRMLTGSRLRTLPYLPPSKRPEVITSKAGKEIVVNKVKVEDKERILKRGQVSLVRAHGDTG